MHQVRVFLFMLQPLHRCNQWKLLYIQAAAEPELAQVFKAAAAFVLQMVQDIGRLQKHILYYRIQLTI